MAFEVILARSAVRDIDEYVKHIAQDSPAQAAKWKGSLEEKILSLRDMPSRFSLIPEAANLKLSYRSFVHFSHRIIFRIDDDASKVYVVRVYHGARKPLTRKKVE